MSLEQEVANLVQSTSDLTDSVNFKKTQLDKAVIGTF